MYAERHVVNLTTDSSGDATGYTLPVRGRVLQVVYAKTDFADGVDFVVTNETTGEIIWDEDNVNASAVRAPRIATHSNLGVATLYAAGGAAVLDHICIAGDRIKVVVAAGGSVKTGAVHFIIG